MLFNMVVQTPVQEPNGDQLTVRFQITQRVSSNTQWALEELARQLMRIVNEQNLDHLIFKEVKKFDDLGYKADTAYLIPKLHLEETFYPGTVVYLVFGATGLA